jgi:hypothetical protein
MLRTFRPTALLLLALIAVPAGAAIPGADNPKAYTHHDHVRGKYEFGKRTLTGVYKTMGKRDPKWDAPAEQFLDAMAIYFSYGGADAIYQRKDVPVPTVDQYLALGQAAADAGCDDPLVLYGRAAVIQDAGRANKAGPMVERAVKGMLERKYPAYRICAAANRVAKLLAGRPGADAHRAGFEAIAWDKAIETVSGKLDPREIRYLLETVDDTFDNAPVERKLEFCKAVEASKDADPWMVNYLYGMYEVKAAWKARGGGFADTVTEAGWKGFYAHLAKARDHFVKAHTLHPEFPEPATSMIAVAMGAGDEINEKERDWFDKAAGHSWTTSPPTTITSGRSTPAGAAATRKCSASASSA